MSKKTINKTERKIIDKVLNEIIGDIGYYITSGGTIFYTIDLEKLNQLYKQNNSYELKLPTIEYIREKVKSAFILFDEMKLQDIKYVLEKSKFDKLVSINTDSDVIVHNCTFAVGLIIEKAKKVQMTPNYYLFNHCGTDIDCNSRLIINAEELEFNKCNLNFFGSSFCDDIYVAFNTKEIYMNNLNLISTRNIDINTQNFNIDSSKIFASKLFINADKVEVKNNKMVSTELISINNKSCTSIENVYAPKILYNGIDITQSEQIQLQLPKARQQLIEKLKELKEKCKEGIEEDTIRYQESLEKQPLSKRIMK